MICYLHTSFLRCQQTILDMGPRVILLSSHFFPQMWLTYQCKYLYSYLKYSSRKKTSRNTARCHVMAILFTFSSLQLQPSSLTFDLGSNGRKVVILYILRVKNFYFLHILFVCVPTGLCGNVIFILDLIFKLIRFYVICYMKATFMIAFEVMLLKNS